MMLGFLEHGAKGPVDLVPDEGCFFITPTLLATVAISAGVGAIGSAITGGDPGQGALMGAIGGGIGGFAGGFGGGGGGGGGGVLSSMFGGGGGGSSGNQMPASYSTGDSGSSMGGSPGQSMTPYLDSITGNGMGPSGSLSPLASTASGTSHGLDFTKLALGALSALGAHAGGAQIPYSAMPGPSSTAGTAGPYFNVPLNSNVPGRTALNPFAGGTIDSTNYGHGPEQSFFGNNSAAAYKKGGRSRTKRRFDNGGSVDLPFGGQLDISQYLKGLTIDPVTGQPIAPAATPDTGFLPNGVPLWAQQPGVATTDEVNQLYKTLLGRTPDPVGLSTVGQQQIGDVYKGILGSSEYAGAQAKGLGPSSGVTPDTLGALYQDILGRAPDAIGTKGWTGQSLDEVTKGLLNSPEYIAAQKAKYAPAAAAQTTPDNWKAFQPTVTPTTALNDMTPHARGGRIKRFEGGGVALGMQPQPAVGAPGVAPGLGGAVGGALSSVTTPPNPNQPYIDAQNKAQGSLDYLTSPNNQYATGREDYNTYALQMKNASAGLGNSISNYIKNYQQPPAPALATPAAPAANAPFGAQFQAGVAATPFYQTPEGQQALQKTYAMASLPPQMRGKFEMMLHQPQHTFPGPQQPPMASMGNNAPDVRAPGAPPTNPSQFAGWPGSGVPMAHGGGVNPAFQHALMARGASFSTARGDNFVKGPGDGTSDQVNARLSDGEYVLTAADLARLGNGSNDAGAKKLDKFRTELARKTGQKKFVPSKGDGALGKLLKAA